MVSGLRWGTLAVALSSALARGLIVGHPAVAVWAGVLAGYAAWRSFRPLREDAALGGSSPLLLLFEVGLPTAAVATTGSSDSPLAFCLLAAVVAAGLIRGLKGGLVAALVAAAGVAVPASLGYGGGAGPRFQATAQWLVELFLVAVVASWARQRFGQVERRHSLALDRLSRLEQANALLSALHRVAQSLPASLDLDEALGSTLLSLRDLARFDSMVVLVFEPASSSWTVGAAEGVRISGGLSSEDLPAGLRNAVKASRPVLVEDLGATGEPGLRPASRSAVYAPLLARGTLVGAIAIEHDEPDHFGPQDLEMMRGWAQLVGGALQTPHWCRRLRTLGAAEERTRIARDLHDRLGQSLAYLAFELDRIATRSQKEVVTADLQRLRGDVRSAVTEMRETLYDLRTDVSEARGLVETLAGFLSRVADRSGLEVNFDHRDRSRLPLRQEREVWRVAQEAVANAERHSGARRLWVDWDCDGEWAQLEVRDDGEGFVSGSQEHADAYGITGMRERADAIGAHLEVDSGPGRGCRVRCRLEVPPAGPAGPSTGRVGGRDDVGGLGGTSGRDGAPTS
ncbi:MAG: GAF domain-containing sensor histidine kinase [Acidimicrobiales bacterium]